VVADASDTDAGRFYVFTDEDSIGVVDDRSSRIGASS
jgi:hypothetical protein